MTPVGALLLFFAWLGAAFGGFVFADDGCERSGLVIIAGALWLMLAGTWLVAA